MFPLLAARSGSSRPSGVEGGLSRGAGGLPTFAEGADAPPSGVLRRFPAAIASLRSRRLFFRGLLAERPGLLRLAVAVLAFCSFAGFPTPLPAAERLVDAVPADAAFVTSTLRLEEQVGIVRRSNAFQAILAMPAVRKMLETIEDQRDIPGNPLSMAATMLELPENKQAIDLLRDIVSTDTCLHGGASCVQVARLLAKLQETNQVLGVLQMIGGAGSGLRGDAIDGDDEAARRRVPLLPVLLQVGQIGKAMMDEDLSNEQLGRRMMLDALVENIDSLVLPDLIWSFRTTMPEVASTQIQRLEVILKLVTQASPQLVDAVDRVSLDGGSFVTVTIPGDLVPWAELGLERFFEDQKPEDLDIVLDRLRSLGLVVALGVADDRVILSIGGGLAELEKLLAVADGKGVAMQPAFEPLRAHADRRLTAVSYCSEDFNKALLPGVGYLRRLADLSERLATSAGRPEAAEDVQTLLTRIADDMEKRSVRPGPWMAYSFLADEGYEGYVWDWSGNVPLDGSRRLDLLEHAGGAPLAAVAFRAKTDPAEFDDFLEWTRMIEQLLEKNIEDEETKEKFSSFITTFGPIAVRLATTVREKVLPSLADGQIGLVLDAKAKTSRLHEEMPASADPLPLPEPAIVLGVADPALFREALNDLFEISDEVVEAIRSLDDDAVPEGYRIPAPEKKQVEGGSVWSFPISAKSGLDPQIAPAIGLGEGVAVLSLVPRQAERLVAGTPLETAARLEAFGEPAAGAAVLDWSGLVEAIEPWVVYGVRWFALRDREGDVGHDVELGADDEDDRASEAVRQARTVLEAAKTLRTAAARMTVEQDARVIHWRNVVRDVPAER